MAGVVLETERLILRRPTADDFEASYALTESVTMRQYLGADRASREDSFARHLRNAGSWALYGMGIFSVFWRVDHRYIGGCGLFRSLRCLGEDFDPYPEAGWVIGEADWGRGFATEAMTTILAWFDEEHGGRSVCMIVPGNAGSERIAAKLGYAAFGLAGYKGADVMRYARQASSPGD